MLFSATMPDAIMKLAAAHMKLPTRIEVAEQVLDGLWGANKAVLTAFTNNGYYIVTGPAPTNGVINFSICAKHITLPGAQDSGEKGSFQDALAAPYGPYPDAFFPGIPGTGTAAHNPETFVCEILSYVEFPTNGMYEMGFNSDDGFRITRGFARPNNKGVLAVTSPAVVAGNKAAAFVGYYAGKQLTSPLSGKVVQGLGPGGGAANGTWPGIPAEGCGALVNPAQVAGNIALIYRGTCSYVQKMQAAKDAGAVAVILVNNRPQFSSPNWFPQEATGDPYVDIPTIMIRQSDGNALVAAMQTNNVMATLNPLDFSQDPPASQSPLGEDDRGKGSSNVYFPLFVPQAGVYPLRALHFQGTGGGNAEWFARTPPTSGTRVLLNDSTRLDSLNAYYGLTVAPTVSIGFDGANVSVNYTGTLQTSDGLNGPWTDVYGQPPLVVPASAVQKFFRAR